jgi:dTDP-L-rhamnose 4-epimerase
VGDIRNCYADITLAREVLGYSRAWLRGGDGGAGGVAEGAGEAEDRVESHAAELAARGLTL